MHEQVRASGGVCLAVTDRLVVFVGLDLEARRRFLARVSSELARAVGHIELDCSQVDALNAPTLGMLVTIARVARRRGQRVVLDAPSERVRHDLDDAGVGVLFVWSV
jgi:anti-anti-sigma regulatory factor